MAQKTDLYTILLSYANKHHSPVVEIGAFLKFLGKYANHYAAERPEWRIWAESTQSKFWAGLNALVEAGKCELHNEGPDGQLLILEYYAEVITKAYDAPEVQAPLPFPDEKNLGLRIPPEQIRILLIQEDLGEYMEHPLTADIPVLRIVFPEELGSALFLARHLPQRALECALVKLQYYMQSQNNREYYAVRLSTQFQGKDVLIKDLLKQLEVRPLDLLSNIEEAGEFACLFWPYFGAQIKGELRKKNELTSSDLGAMQSVYLVEFFTGFFRARASREKEREQALRELEAKLERQPYLYSFRDILGFTDGSGKMLAEILGQGEVEKLLHEKTTKVPESEDAKLTLPAFMIFRNRFDEQVFISKAKIFPLVTKLIGEARQQIQKTVSARWTKLVKDYRREPPMENDRDFERVLAGYVSQVAPNLNMFLQDQKVYLVQAELEHLQGGVMQYTRVFDDHGAPLPLAVILPLDRKTLLADVKILLPFWYSVPILSAIIGFFRRLGTGKRPAPAEEEEEEPEEKSRSRGGSEPGSMDQLLKKAAQQFQEEKIPQGQTAGQYLRSLEKRWRKILDEEAHRQMSQDVQGLIKKKLSRMLAIRSGKKPSVQMISELADAIIFETPSFMDLDSTEAMKLYISVYISRILRG